MFFENQQISFIKSTHFIFATLQSLCANDLKKPSAIFLHLHTHSQRNLFNLFKSTTFFFLLNSVQLKEAEILHLCKKKKKILCLFSVVLFRLWKQVAFCNSLQVQLEKRKEILNCFFFFARLGPFAKFMFSWQRAAHEILLKHLNEINFQKLQWCCAASWQFPGTFSKSMWIFVFFFNFSKNSRNPKKT